MHLEDHDLLKKYVLGQCSEEEELMVDLWYQNYNQDSPKTPNDIILRMQEEINKNLSVPRSRKIPLYLKVILAVASVIFILGIWTLLFTPVGQLPEGYANDVNPGANKAILTLANGKTIPLSDAKNGIKLGGNALTYTDGTPLEGQEKSNGAQTVSTPRGGQYEVVLPDGTKVWLNAASSLTYNSFLKNNRGERQVSVVGEAYFEVVKDKHHPFIVVTKGQQIRVLGTHFNVSAYPDESATKTTLLEGSVSVSATSNLSPLPGVVQTDDSKTVLLKPNQQSSLISGKIKVTQTDSQQDIAWKNGEFMFRKESLESIMRKIGRWYDVEIVYENKQVGKQLFGGTISRFGKLSDVLCMLELTGDVRFKIEGRRITIK